MPAICFLNEVVMAVFLSKINCYLKPLPENCGEVVKIDDEGRNFDFEPLNLLPLLYENQ